MTELYILSAKNWLSSLSLASAILSGRDREVYFFDPGQEELEKEALALLTGRLPLKLYNLTGDSKVDQLVAESGRKPEKNPLSGGFNFDTLVATFGMPAGICVAEAENPADCLKAAMLAVRLGYYFMASSTSAFPEFKKYPDLTVTWIGTPDALETYAQKVKGQEWTVIEDDQQLLAAIERAGLSAEYLVLYNSADLLRETTRGISLGELWVSGLSLHLLTLASYRPVFPFDAQSSDPDPQVIEECLNRMVSQIGLKPRFLTVLASPAVIPFFYEEKKMIGPVTEEMVRDIHLRLNDDIFFDLAEGRLMQNSSGGISAQLICTKRYTEVQEHLKRIGRDVLIVATPHVETGIIFSTDDALIDTQLLPLMEDAGYLVNQLRDRDAGYREVASALQKTDYFLYTGHGGPEGLHTHGRTLNGNDLPLMPPLVAYASACSTVGLVPHWYSNDEGLTWEGVPVDSRQVIGLSFVEKGAICFVGGATIEDLQYTTSTYSVFMEALLLKNLSIGEAVREMRQVISLYAATLLQKNPEAYRKYRWGTANAIHQQILLGDPAFVPAQEKYTDAALPKSLEGDAPLQKLTVEIPEELWQRGEAAVHKMEASKYYYRCSNVQVITPYGEDIFSWGDYYRIAPDARNISEWAVKSTFLHITHDLPPGMAPKRLSLIEAEAGESECLLCGEEADQYLSPLEAMLKFKLPYLLQPPIEFNMEQGWAFSVEQHDHFLRMRWLAPLLLIDDTNRTAVPLKKFVFQIESAPLLELRGRISNQLPGSTYLVCAGQELKSKTDQSDLSQPLAITAAVISGKDGAFAIKSAPGSSLLVQQQFPLYDLLEDYQSFKSELIVPEGNGFTIVELKPQAKSNFRGFLYDSLNGEALPGAVIRVFRGEHDPVGDILLEAFAGEAMTGVKGEFSLLLPAGNYLVYAAAKLGNKYYKSAEWILKLRDGEAANRVYALDQAGIIKGKVLFEGYQPPDPAMVAIKRFPKIEGAAALTKVPVNRDGSYQCLVSYQDRFQISIEEEGRQYVYDQNEGKGYRLEPQEVLERSYLLVPDQEA